MATVRMPISWQVRATRSAISPRLAMRILRMLTARHPSRIAAASPPRPAEPAPLRNLAVLAQQRRLAALQRQLPARDPDRHRLAGDFQRISVPEHHVSARALRDAADGPAQ